MTYDEMEAVIDLMEEFIDLVWENYPQSRRALIAGSMRYAGLGEIAADDLLAYQAEQRELWG